MDAHGVIAETKGAGHTMIQAPVLLPRIPGVEEIARGVLQVLFVQKQVVVIQPFILIKQHVMLFLIADGKALRLLAGVKPSLVGIMMEIRQDVKVQM